MARAVIALGPVPARESAVRVSGRADALDSYLDAVVGAVTVLA